MTDRMPTDGEGEALCYLVTRLSYEASRATLHAAIRAGWASDDPRYSVYDITISGYDALIRWLAAKRVALEKEGARK